jgi:hypothetical protein
MIDFQCQSRGTLSCDGHLLPLGCHRWHFLTCTSVLTGLLYPPVRVCFGPSSYRHIIALFQTPQFREQTSLSFDPGHIWKRTCKRKRRRPRSTRSGPVVMNALLQIPKLQYAVIQLSSITDPPERLILAYTDERTLRALIAGPSIAGLGFGSREEAVSTENPTLEKAVAPTPANALESARPGQHQPDCRGGRAAAWSSLSSLRRLASGIVQFAFAATICIFYSKNIVSATIRMVLAGSV